MLCPVSVFFVLVSGRWTMVHIRNCFQFTFEAMLGASLDHTSAGPARVAVHHVMAAELMPLMMIRRSSLPLPQTHDGAWTRCEAAAHAAGSAARHY